MKRMLLELTGILAFLSLTPLTLNASANDWRDIAKNPKRTMTCTLSVEQGEQSQTLAQKTVILGLLNTDRYSSNHSLVLQSADQGVSARVTCERCWCDSMFPIYPGVINPNTTGLRIEMFDRLSGTANAGRRGGQFFGKQIGLQLQRAGSGQVIRVSCTAEKRDQGLPCRSIKGGVDEALRDAEEHGVLPRR